MFKEYIFALREYGITLREHVITCREDIPTLVAHIITSGDYIHILESIY